MATSPARIRSETKAESRARARHARRLQHPRNRQHDRSAVGAWRLVERRRDRCAEPHVQCRLGEEAPGCWELCGLKEVPVRVVRGVPLPIGAAEGDGNRRARSGERGRQREHEVPPTKIKKVPVNRHWAELALVLPTLVVVPDVMVPKVRSAERDDLPAGLRRTARRRPAPASTAIRCHGTSTSTDWRTGTWEAAGRQPGRAGGSPPRPRIRMGRQASRRPAT